MCNLLTELAHVALFNWLPFIARRAAQEQVCAYLYTQVSLSIQMQAKCGGYHQRDPKLPSLTPSPASARTLESRVYSGGMVALLLMPLCLLNLCQQVQKVT